MTESAIKAIQDELFRHFTRFDISALRSLLKMVGHPNPNDVRRDEAIFYLIQRLQSKAALRELWDILSPITQKALSVTIHTTDGIYRPDLVRLRYGQAPPPPQRYWSGYIPTELDLFLDEDQKILPELYPLLRVVAPKPEKWEMPVHPEPPPRYESIGFERSPGPDVGLQDLTTVLALAGQERLLVNDRMLPTYESIQLVLENLVDGDFLDEEALKDVNEAIKPVGLIRFALGSGLVTLGARTGYNTTLKLSPVGWEWLIGPSADLLLDALENWTNSDLFDEIDRIDHLRNAAKPGESRTPPKERRDSIVETLSWSPQGAWLSVDDFFTALKLWQHDFEVDPDLDAIDDNTGRKMSIQELKDPWRAVQGVYTLVVLFEILGSLGALDLAYTQPQHAPPFLDAPTESWQRPAQPYSRYDGLTYFRINDLGAYLFGHSRRYNIPRICSERFFIIDERYTFRPVRKKLQPYQRQILPLLGTEQKNGKFKLDKAAWLQAQQTENTLKERKQLLLARHDGPLSPKVEDWLEQIEADSTALRKGRTMITIQVRRPEVRNAILEDPELRRYCRLLDDRTLLIPSSRDRAFTRKVMQLGYGVVGGTNGK
jgi:hypothetical protein